MVFAALPRRAQVARLRALARRALAVHGLEAARLRLLQYEYNTTFRVDADGGPYVLRIGRASGQTGAALSSEAAWLRALAAETEIVVPEPVPAHDGRLVVEVSTEAVPERRACVLLRWVGGRFVEGALTPVHARRMARLMAALHTHALAWTPPPGFMRPPVSRLTARVGDGPEADAAEAVRLVSEHVGVRDADAVTAALAEIRGTERALAALPGATTLLHGDLHHENVLFAAGEARAIDFDDCGRGPLLYDLAVPRFEWADRPALRDALLGEYAALRGLPPRAEQHLAVLELLRRLQMLIWVLESREHPHFRGRWRTLAREDLDAVAAALG